MQQLETEAILKGLSQEQLSQLLINALQQQSRINRIEISELFDKHRRYCRSRELASVRLGTYETAYKHFQGYTESKGILYVDEITYDHAEEFYEYVKSHPRHMKRDGTLATRSVITMYKLIKAMFAYAERRDYILKNPFINKVYPVAPITDWWTDKYFEQVITAIRTFTKPHNILKTELITRLIYTTGLRVGILHRVRRGDIYHIEETGELFLTTDVKINKSAEVTRVTTEVLDETAKKMFLTYIRNLDKEGIDTDQLIFVKNGTARTGYHNFKQTFKKLCKKAGLKYLSPHKAKHGFITKMARAGLSAEQICKLTGNRTPSLVQKVYMHLFQDDVKDIARAVINQNKS